VSDGAAPLDASCLFVGRLDEAGAIDNMAGTARYLPQILQRYEHCGFAGLVTGCRHDKFQYPSIVFILNKTAFQG
jgi:hypothetical protein